MSTPSDIVMKLSLKGELKLGATVQAVLLIGHAMESGFRVLDLGQRVPKNVIERITVSLDSALILQMETGIGISANPYFSFPITLPLTAAAPLVLAVAWLDDRGAQGQLERVLV